VTGWQRSGAGAEDEGEDDLQFAHHLVEGHPGAGTFWVRPEQGAEGLGQDGEGDVAAPAGERAAFEVVQAQAGLELAVVVPGPPSDLGQADQLGGGGVPGQGGQPVAGGLVSLGWPLG
jgi:hypothetical protein